MLTNTGGTTYECQTCLKSFPEAGHLKKHMRTHVNGELKCDICKKSFFEKGILKRNMRTHTGEKPYECDTCSIAHAIDLQLPEEEGEKEEQEYDEQVEEEQE